MTQSSENKGEEGIFEEFDEKMKFPHEQKQTEDEMKHIFNQFNENTSTDVKRPLLNSTEINIVPDTPIKQDISFDFNKFVDQMKHRSSKPITRYFKSFLQAFDRRPWTVNEQIKIIQDFLDFIYVKMRESEIWRDMSEQEFENAKEGMEKLVMNRLHHLTFTPSTTDDKERDEILHQKISLFRWIREKHLDIPETEHNQRFLTFAETELLKINTYKAPRDKLICILNSCKVIFGLIKHVEGDAGADKFLPILIYVVIRANPPKLVSNVQYIHRFRSPNHLEAEAGYYLTNLMGAISFIETMDSNSLSITKEEFDSNIEKTITELNSERPIEYNKPQINYENVLHPSTRSMLDNNSQQSVLLDPSKAAALLERGSQFAQKTMQRPFNFVGKIIQGLSDNSNSSSRAESEDEDEVQHYSPLPPLPPRPNEQTRQQMFDTNLQILNSMFTNVDDSVCYLVLSANNGDLTTSIDNLLEMSGDNNNIYQQTPIQPTPL